MVSHLGEEDGGGLGGEGGGELLYGKNVCSYSSVFTTEHFSLFFK